MASLQQTVNIFPLWSTENFFTVNFFLQLTLIIAQFLRLTIFLAVSRLTVNPIETLGLLNSDAPRKPVCELGSLKSRIKNALWGKLFNMQGNVFLLKRAHRKLQFDFLNYFFVNHFSYHH